MSDPAKYRTKEELAAYKKRDPIEQVKETILKKKYLTEEDLENIHKETKVKVEESVKFAEESAYPSASEIFTDVYVQKDYPFIKD
jgi:pyruvate dehydrogenase E1 component alpha subunit